MEYLCHLYLVLLWKWLGLSLSSWKFIEFVPSSVSFFLCFHLLLHRVYFTMPFYLLRCPLFIATGHFAHVLRKSLALLLANIFPSHFLSRESLSDDLLLCWWLTDLNNFCKIFLKISLIHLLFGKAFSLALEIRVDTMFFFEFFKDVLFLFFSLVSFLTRILLLPSSLFLCN